MNPIWFVLSSIKGLGAVSIKKIYYQIPDLTIENLQNDKTISSLKRIIKKKYIIDQLQDNTLMMQMKESAISSIHEHQKVGIEVVSLSDEMYPGLLKDISNPPPVIFCKGNINLLKNRNKLNIIGTREPSEMGLKIAYRITEQFVKRGFLIVSGLAHGIDTAVHEKTLQVNGQTIAVLAGGLDSIYPKSNEKLAESILKQEGLLISEYPIGTKPFKQMFVQRDRIQSGISLGVCPIQMSLKSGTKQTVEYARKQKRVIFCPEPQETNNSSVNAGIFELIQNNLCEVISSKDDYDRIIKLMEDI